MTLISKGYQSDFGTVPAASMPKDIWSAFANARLKKNGDFDARTKSGKAAMRAKADLDAMILDAYNNYNDGKLRRLGLSY